MEHILRINCKDEKGLVFKISALLYNKGFNITRNDEFVDTDHGRFFMRTTFEGDCDRVQLAEEMKQILPENARVRCLNSRKKDVVILVTREHHCLSDLLVRNHYGDMNINIKAVIGNYEDLRELTVKFGVPFYHIPSEGCTRNEHEAKTEEILATLKFDFIVLAKFMRILTPDFVRKYERQIINIHHSFLPAFIGANPYRQAYQRGVKMIGATSHFVTDDLDEGPIIYQDIIKVNHSQNARELAKMGRDVERKVLAEALRLVFDDKVFIYGNKTVVFD
ncbi:formyltetrahydrofolate deformylase [Weeksellaceae bacterium A-14]|uniref:formyltetrahydrofolate deformylase n=1 Tax=Daejeonia sp. YH14 TaxID=3439042 RepID=UPI0031E4BECF